MILSTVSSHVSSPKARTAAHRAIAALASNCILPVRYRRYHTHIGKAQALLSASDVFAPESVQEVRK